MYRSLWTAVLLYAAICNTIPTPAQANVFVYGTAEQIVPIKGAATNIVDGDGTPYVLGYKITAQLFGIPYSFTDDGYVLTYPYRPEWELHPWLDILNLGAPVTYFALTQEDIRSFPQRGDLPKPLPTYELSWRAYSPLIWNSIIELFFACS